MKVEISRRIRIKPKYTMLLIILPFFLLTACLGSIRMKVEPVELKAETPNLNIETSKKLTLKLAVVVQDPMAYTIIYDLPGSYNRDVTPEYRKGGFLLERELSKVCSETFSQAFEQIIVMRELPLPGEYDIVLQLKIGKISAIGRNRAFGFACDVTTEWSMAVFDNENKEILTKKGVSSPRSFQWGALTAAHGFTHGMGLVMSATLTDLARQWGTFLYSSDIMAAQAAKRQKKQ